MQALWGEASGIHDTTFQSIMKCDVVIRKDLHARVVLSGGTTMVAGIGERMTNELAAQISATIAQKSFASQAVWGEASGIHDTTFQSIMKCDDVPARTFMRGSCSPEAPRWSLASENE